MRDLTQLNRLEEYLKAKGIQYERIDKEDEYLDENHPYCLVEFERREQDE